MRPDKPEQVEITHRFERRIERKLGNFLDALEAYVRSLIAVPPDNTATTLEVTGQIVDKPSPPAKKE